VDTRSCVNLGVATHVIISRIRRALEIDSALFLFVVGW
jgi:hypothetical protein